MGLTVQNKYRNLSVEHRSLFQQKLSRWYTHHTRAYPWIGEKDPYKVWLSEIILQQTRVDQGLPYYKNFLQYFPTILDLAEGDEQFIFRLWQGLGYYNRCKNMIKTSKIVRDDYQGVFPKNYENIIKLPGIGPYTAAAISSFAFGLPYAVVDGNVERFLARYFGLEEPVNTSKGKKLFTQVASDLLNEHDPASFNQAMMDFGATVCTPRKPFCKKCPFQTNCVALKEHTIDKLPVKKKKIKIKKRYFNYYVLRYNDGFYIRKRPSGDIWQNLHEFLLSESDHQLSKKELLATEELKSIHKDAIGHFSELSSINHQLTHQKLYIQFLEIELNERPNLSEDFFLIKQSNRDNFAFPRPMVTYLDKLENKE